MVAAVSMSEEDLASQEFQELKAIVDGEQGVKAFDTWKKGILSKVTQVLSFGNKIGGHDFRGVACQAYSDYTLFDVKPFYDSHVEKSTKLNNIKISDT